MGKYVAVYLPSDKAGRDQGGFDTQELAWEYVFEHGMCLFCKQERHAARHGDPESSSFPGCACEWMVITQEEYDELQKNRNER